MKQLTLTTTATPSTLPLHEANARRRRGKVVPTPGKADQRHSNARKGSAQAADESKTLLDTYIQFTPQGPLHE